LQILRHIFFSYASFAIHARYYFLTFLMFWIFLQLSILSYQESQFHFFQTLLTGSIFCFFHELILPKSFEFQRQVTLGTYNPHFNIFF